jgi:hypothetical protein
MSSDRIGNVECEGQVRTPDSHLTELPCVGLAGVATGVSNRATTINKPIQGKFNVRTASTVLLGTLNSGDNK